MPGKIQLREAAQLDEARMLLHVGTLGLALLTPSRRLSPVASQLSQRSHDKQEKYSSGRTRFQEMRQLPGLISRLAWPPPCISLRV